MAREFGVGFFGGSILVQGCLGFVRSARSFSGFSFLPPFDQPFHLISRVLPPGSLGHQISTSGLDQGLHVQNGGAFS